MSTKTCSACKVEKPLIGFTPSDRYSDGYRGQCNECRVSYNARWLKTAKGRETKQDGGRSYQLRKKYGISLQQYDDLLRQQNYRCALCGTDKPTRSAYNGQGNHQKFSVDHCHKTGLVRGLLCIRCNHALCVFGDSYEGFERVLKYLSISVRRI